MIEKKNWSFYLFLHLVSINHKLVLRTADMMIFSAPDFVKMLEDDDYVYLFLREQAVEYINCGKVSRVSQH